MNIFVLHTTPAKAARWHADKHVVKMLLESVQMLYTSHWIVAFPALLKHRSALAISKAQKTLPTPPALRFGLSPAPRQHKDPSQHGFRPVHLHHPCSRWVRESLANYQWLCALALALAREHHHRWPDNPPHSCEAHARWLTANPPALPRVPPTHFAIAMPLEYHRSNPVSAYRAFYKGSKTERGITKSYTRRHRPHWLHSG